MNHLLQVCNVGNIVGGTAACAWTVTRCFPEWRHTVVFLSEITAETRRAFADCRVERWARVTRVAVRKTATDIVLLHNIRVTRCETDLPIPSVMYLHSRTEPAAADVTIACSHWLAERTGLPANSVVHQAVPRPPLLSVSQANQPDLRSLREFPVIGRICTPQAHKWPAEMVPFYQSLAARFPRVDWEFVGCPAEMQPGIGNACRGRAVFHSASFPARSLLWRWDAMLYHNPHVTESFGRTVAEAMRAGCIPIVDNRGGFREQITPGCGFLCDDPSEFHAAVDAIHPPRRAVRTLTSLPRTGRRGVFAARVSAAVAANPKNLLKNSQRFESTVQPRSIEN